MKEFPIGLKSAADIAKYTGLTEERVLDLAASGYLPHYRIDNGAPQFRTTEVKNWLAQNAMVKCDGRPMPEAIRVVIPAPPVVDRPPASIMNVPGLQQLPVHGWNPGVYFLCKGDEVVYVGQSVAPGSRIAGHASDRYKDFDRVYLLPVPGYELNNVEGAFIQHLRPPQQGYTGNYKNKQPVVPRMTRNGQEVLKDWFGPITEAATQE